MQRKRLEQAAASAVSATELSEAWGTLGMYFHAYEQTAAARECYAQAARLGPADPRWPYYLGLIQYFEGDFEAGPQSFQKVAVRTPRDVPALLWSARCLLQLGRGEDLTRGSTAALNLGAALAQSGKFQEVSEVLQESLSLDLSSAERSKVHFNLGSNQLLERRPKAAVRSFQEAVEWDPDNFAARQRLESTSEKIEERP